MAMTDFLFTSESVTEGHPDKVADQVSDSILDAILAQDPQARVACETLVTTGMAMIAGEITTTARIDYPDIVRQTIREIGYDDSAMGFDWETCAVLTAIDRQSPDISQGVTEGEGLFKDQGAGDQGLMFGYACNETPELMPMPITFAHKLTKRLSDVRKSGLLPFLRPDGKSQVSIQYINDKPIRVDTVVVSSQHTPEVKYETLKEAIIEEVVKQIIPGRPAGRKNQIFHQSHRPFRCRRPDGRLRPDRAQDHCRYLRGAGLARRRRFLRQGPLEGRSQRFLYGPLCGQEHRRRRSGQ